MTLSEATSAFVLPVPCGNGSGISSTGRRPSDRICVLLSANLQMVTDDIGAQRTRGPQATTAVRADQQPPRRMAQQRPPDDAAQELLQRTLRAVRQPPPREPAEFAFRLPQKTKALGRVQRRKVELVALPAPPPPRTPPGGAVGADSKEREKDRREKEKEDSGSWLTIAVDCEVSVSIPSPSNRGIPRIPSVVLMESDGPDRGDLQSIVMHDEEAVTEEAEPCEDAEVRLSSMLQRTMATPLVDKTRPVDSSPMADQRPGEDSSVNVTSPHAAPALLECMIERAMSTAIVQPDTGGSQNWCEEDEAAEEEEMADLEGYMEKLSSGLVREWQSRWFELWGEHLYYFVPPTQPNAANVTRLIPLKMAEVTDISDADAVRPWKLRVRGPGLPRDLCLACASEEERNLWLVHLRNAAALASEPEGEHCVFSSSKRSVCLSDFDLISVLGRGSYGKVMQVRHKATGEIFAMKVMRKSFVVKRNMVEKCKAEKFILQSLQNPYIVKLHYAFHTKSRIYLVLDLLPGGDLFFHIRKNKFLPLERARIYAAELVAALQYLHSQDIVYRDLKPENVLIDAAGYCCITDFGLAKTNITTVGGLAFSFVGTPEYAAPEVINGKGHSKAVDWWALGCLLYEMLCGFSPFRAENHHAMFRRILTAPVVFPDHVPNTARSLIQGLLQKDPVRRLTDPDAIKAHYFFASINFAMVELRRHAPAWVPDPGSAQSGVYVDAKFRLQRANLSPHDTPVLGSGFSIGSSTSYGSPTDPFTGFTYNTAQRASMSSPNTSPTLSPLRRAHHGFGMTPEAYAVS